MRVLHDLRRRRLLAAPDVAAVTVPLRRDHPGGASFQLAYAIAGPEVLVALLRRVAAGRRPLLWRRLASAVAAEVASGKPLVFELSLIHI